MADNRQKSEWIESVMASTQGMRPAEPRADIYEAVRSRMNNRLEVKTVPLPVARWAAAAILLLALNIGSAIYYVSYKHHPAATNAENTFAAELQPVSTYNY